MKYDFCILGAGLAGLSVAKEISSNPDVSVIVIDPHGIGGGASGSPIGLANPATGRFATKSWKAEESIEAIQSNLEKVSPFSSEKFFSRSGVMRPAMDSKIARRMKENLESNKWPVDWCEWLSEDEIKTRFPNLHSEHGGVWVSTGITVAIPKYLQALSRYLKRNGVQVLDNKKFGLDRSSDSWNFNLSDDTQLEAEHLITTAGIKTKEFDFWKELPLHPVKGQVAIFECEDSFPFKAAISALGYFASLDSKTFVAGSTYEHNFTHEEVDMQGKQYIEKRMLRVIPQLKGKYRLIDQWSGVRASTPDRMPIIGLHPSIENCSVFAGLGSKGLLYSSLLAKEISRLLIDDLPVSSEISQQRFNSK
ncbi:MAG: FAD-dependent oxidoreductase [Balneola sp.]|jgi:glycine oxidase